jgi:hypothetical protein
MNNAIGISLGWNCYSAAKGVEMGIRSRKANGYNTCPFDELLTNYPGVVECIRDDFSGFLDLKYLELFKVSDKSPYCTGDTLIRNTKYKFVFNHESPGHAGLWQSEGWPGGINHFVANSFEKFKERYEKRIENFRNYLNSGESVIFLLTRPYPVEMSEPDTVLAEKYPNLTYKVIYLDLQREPEHFIRHLEIMGFSYTDPEVKRAITK